MESSVTVFLLSHTCFVCRFRFIPFHSVSISIKLLFEMWKNSTRKKVETKKKIGELEIEIIKISLCIYVQSSKIFGHKKRILIIQTILLCAYKHLFYDKEMCQKRLNATHMLHSHIAPFSIYHLKRTPRRISFIYFEMLVLALIKLRQLWPH